MRSVVRGGLAALVTLLLLPSVASADGVAYFSNPALFYHVTGATTGDRLTVSASGGEAVIDSEQAITSPDCTLDDGDTRATCPVNVGVYLALSDFDDTLRAGSITDFTGIHVNAGGGNDVVVGGPRNDTLIGGAGDDILSDFDSFGDSFDCGPGFDRVTVGLLDTVSLDCEVINGELRDLDDDGILDASDDCPTAPGPGTSTGCPADTAACHTARDKLATAKKRLKALQRTGAPEPKIKKAKRKRERARDAVADACGT